VEKTILIYREIDCILHVKAFEKLLEDLNLEMFPFTHSKENFVQLYKI
jgi:hypothetical protein